MAAKRKVSDEFITKAWKELRSIAKTAKRVGLTYVGAGRRLNKLGLVRSRA
jgi:hypothetical protein